jgi:primary-amine oxidase
VTHPLEPLSATEIELGVELFRAACDGERKPSFSSAGLVEPGKADLKAGRNTHRVLKLLGVDGATDGGFAALVDLTAREVVSIERLPSEAQSPYNFFELGMAIELTRTHPEFRAALEKRGVATATEEDLKLVQVDPWPGGGYPHSAIPAGHRSVRCIAFVRTDASDNGYARPVHGLIAHVDVTEGMVVAVEDHGVIPLPQAPGRFDSANQATTRAGLKDLSITQPDGPSFDVDGYQVRWQGYEFCVGFHPIHGLVLHQLSIGGRPVMYRAALSEMVVPYGDSDPMHRWKHVLDASEYGMGTLVNSLKLGCDCLGEIHYFDVHQVSWNGDVRSVENAICMHEEDYGIQWKHTDLLLETSEVRRSRRLVVSSIFTVGNYDYGFYWYLYLDGTIQMEVKLTGIVGVSAVSDGNLNLQQSPLISAELSSPVHQHAFSFRLDWDLDGGENSLYENEIEVLPIDEQNPDGTQFRSVSRHLIDEAGAQRNVAPEVSRNWKVTNPSSLNGLGQPVAYKLLPGPSPALFAHPESQVVKRAGFGKHHLWATPYAEDELSAAGPYTVMHSGQGGLPELTAGNRDIGHCDLVMWHTVAVTHVPRPEDWPVMPVEYCGFHLIPVGFFDRNPTLDLPAACGNDG